MWLSLSALCVFDCLPPHPPFFHLPLILFLLGHFPSIPDWTSPFLFFFFSLRFQTLTVLLLRQHEVSNLLSIPLFNSIGQLYLSLYSLALLCLFPSFITSHLHSNYKHWMRKQLAVSFATANVLWMSQNRWSEWNTAQFNLVKLSLFVRASVPIIYSWCYHFQWVSEAPYTVPWHKCCHLGNSGFGDFFWRGQYAGKGSSLLFAFSLFLPLAKFHYSFSNAPSLTLPTFKAKTFGGGFCSWSCKSR